MSEKIEKDNKKGPKHRTPPPKAPIRVLNEFKELNELTKRLPTFVKLKNIKNESKDAMMTWTGILCPENEPYNKGAWKIEFQLSPNFPEEPPKLRFLTPIYHPNVDLNTGEAALDLEYDHYWRSSTEFWMLLKIINEMLEKPNFVLENYFVRNAEAAKQYKRNVKEFNKKAAEHAEKHPIIIIEDIKTPL